MAIRVRKVSLLACTGILSGMLVVVPGTAQAAGTTYYVNEGAGCSDHNSGTSSAAPLCTITAGARKAVPGDTVEVADGTYPEQVTAVAGGVTYVGGSRVRVVGSDTVAATAWAPASGDAYAAQPGWPAPPAQVLAGAMRLTKAPTAADVATTDNTWFWEGSTQPGTLLVNTGGDPGSTIQSTWTYGFLLRGVTGVTIDGFSVTGQTGAGISLDTGTSGSTVQDTTVSQSGGYGISDSGGTQNTITRVRTTANISIGIRVLNSSGDVVSASTSDHNGLHGVSIQGGAENVVRGVTAYSNLRPGTRVAAGIDVSGNSGGALVEKNTAYGNDDSGIEIYAGSTGAVVRDNLSYDNNDHGIDISRAPDAAVVSNTIVGNNSSGLNVEGGSTGTTVRDNIAVDNTAIPDRSKGDIRVDAASVPGTTVDDDLVFQSTATTTPIFEWNGTTYTDFEALRSASGQEAHGLDTDPAFVSLAGRDLRLTGHSPGVDAADSTAPAFSARDHDGTARVDNPTVRDTGPGALGFADLGALEFTGAYAEPPVITVASQDGLTTDLDASNSGTLGEPETGRTIDCGNGQAPVSGSTARCVYPASGSYTVSVTVTGKVVNGHSWSDTARTVASVTHAAPPTVTLTLGRTRIRQGESVTATASTGPGTTVQYYRFNCGSGWTAPQSGPSAKCTYTRTGTYTVRVQVKDALGDVAAATGTVTVRPGVPPTASLSLSRSVVHRRWSITARAGASTGTAVSGINGYRFACGNGHRTGWQASARTTCRYPRAGRYAVKVWVRNTLGLVDTARRVVRVRR